MEEAQVKKSSKEHNFIETVEWVALISTILIALYKLRQKS